MNGARRGAPGAGAFGAFRPPPPPGSQFIQMKFICCAGADGAVGADGAERRAVGADGAVGAVGAERRAVGADG